MGLTLTVDAFGSAGHRIIGTLAELHLKDTRALKEIRRILPPNQTLADAAVWPDTIKDPIYEDADTNIYKLNHPAHDTYHYANLPFQSERYAPDVTGARPSDIVQTTREAIRVLKTGKGMFSQREALRIVAHLVGDIHQPLHVGTAFIASSGRSRSSSRTVRPAGARRSAATSSCMDRRTGSTCICTGTVTRSTSPWRGGRAAYAARLHAR